MSETTAGTVAIPFAIGSEVWWVGPQWTERYETCPDCVGTKVVTLTLGNGETETLACALCSVGFDPPRGIVKQTVCGYEPTLFRCERVEIGRDRVTYHSTAGDGRFVYAEELFSDRDACAAACDAKRLAAQQGRDATFLAIRKGKRRDLAWSVSYWRAERKRLAEQIARIDARLGAIAERDQ